MVTHPAADPAPQPPYPYQKRENPAFTEWVERRAAELCADAVPSNHADARPCLTHLQVARWEGFGAWGLGP
jgi:hypothetical protein